MNLNAEALKSDLERAAETNNPDAIKSLSKSESVFYVCHLLGVDFPEDHPSEYNGAVSRGTLQSWAQVLGDYAERNGTEAFHADEVLRESDESDDESDESDESDE